jgi:hypothetical protein
MYLVAAPGPRHTHSRVEDPVPLNLHEAIDLLTNSTSAKRRQGAKRLRTLADPNAAPSIRTALATEVLDPRTWETQYQLVMALAMTGDQTDVPLLKSVASQERKPTMVNVALGDALVRLGGWSSGTDTTLDWCLEQPISALDDGALRAVAMLRLALDATTIERILNHVRQEDPHSGSRFWPAVAAAGWSGDSVHTFLRTCAEGPRQDVADAAIDSLNGVFFEVSPL